MDKNKCPHCGASLNITEGEKKFRCEHCQTIIAEVWLSAAEKIISPTVRSILLPEGSGDMNVDECSEAIEMMKNAIDFAEDPRSMTEFVAKEIYDAILGYTDEYPWNYESYKEYEEYLERERIMGHPNEYENFDEFQKAVFGRLAKKDPIKDIIDAAIKFSEKTALFISIKQLFDYSAKLKQIPSQEVLSYFIISCKRMRSMWHQYTERLDLRIKNIIYLHDSDISADRKNVIRDFISTLKSEESEVIEILERGIPLYEELWSTLYPDQKVELKNETGGRDGDKVLKENEAEQEENEAEEEKEMKERLAAIMSKCPDCGSSLNITEGEKKLRCEHCQTILADAWLKKGISLLPQKYSEDIDGENLYIEVCGAFASAINFAEDPEIIKKAIIQEIYDKVSNFSKKEKCPWIYENYAEYKNANLQHVIPWSDVKSIITYMEYSKTNLNAFVSITDKAKLTGLFLPVFSFVFDVAGKDPKLLLYAISYCKNLASVFKGSLEELENINNSLYLTSDVQNTESLKSLISQARSRIDKLFSMINEYKLSCEKLWLELDPEIQKIGLEKEEERKKLEKKEIELEKEKKGLEKKKKEISAIAWSYGFRTAQIVVFIVVFIMIILALTVVDHLDEKTRADILGAAIFIGSGGAIFAGIIAYLFKKESLQSEIENPSQKNGKSDGN